MHHTQVCQFCPGEGVIKKTKQKNKKTIETFYQPELDLLLREILSRYTVNL